MEKTIPNNRRQCYNSTMQKYSFTIFQLLPSGKKGVKLDEGRIEAESKDDAADKAQAFCDALKEPCFIVVSLSSGSF